MTNSDELKDAELKQHIELEAVAAVDSSGSYSRRFDRFCNRSVRLVLALYAQVRRGDCPAYRGGLFRFGDSLLQKTIAGRPY